MLTWVVLRGSCGLSPWQSPPEPALPAGTASQMGTAHSRFPDWRGRLLTGEAGEHQQQDPTALTWDLCCVAAGSSATGPLGLPPGHFALYCAALLPLHGCSRHPGEQCSLPRCCRPGLPLLGLPHFIHSF